MYSLSLKVGNETFESSADTMSDAIRNLPKPPSLMHKGVLTITGPARSKTLLMMPPRMKRLWMKLSPTFLGKSFELLVK